MNKMRINAEYIGLYVELYDVITNLHKNGKRSTKKLAQGLKKYVMV